MSRPFSELQTGTYRNDSLIPEIISLEKDDKVVPKVLKPGESVNLERGQFSGFKLKVSTANTLDTRRLLEQVAILDTETTGKMREAQITEVAVAQDLFSERPRVDLMLVEPDMLFMSSSKDASSERRTYSGIFDVFERLSKEAPDLFDKTKPAIKDFKDVLYLDLLRRQDTVDRLKAQSDDLFTGLSKTDKQKVLESLDYAVSDAGKRDVRSLIQLAENLHLIKQDPKAIATVEAAFRETERFQARYYFDDLLQQFPKEVQDRLGYLRGKDVTEKQVRDLLKLSQQYVDMDFDQVDINLKKIKSRDIARNLEQALQGKITFIANAAFEAKHIGAEVRASVLERARADQLPGEEFSVAFRKALEKELTGSEGLVNVTKMSGLTGEPFYVSGKEYVEARLDAFRRQDFSLLNRTILQYAKPGDTVDILDLVRSQQSMLQQLGLLSGDKPLAIGIEVQARLFRASEVAAKGDVNAALNILAEFKELHLSEADALISERQVTKNALEQGNVLSQILIDGRQAADVDQSLLKQAMFYSEFQQRLIDKNVAQINTNQRLGRYLIEYGEQGRFSDSNIRGQVIREDVQHFHKKGNQLIAEVVPRNQYRKAFFDRYADLEDLLERVMTENKNPNTAQHLKDIRSTLLTEGIIEEINPDVFEFTLDGRKQALRLGSRLAETAAEQIELVKAISQEDVSGIQRRVNERLKNLSTVRSQALQSGLTRTFENTTSQVVKNLVPNHPVGGADVLRPFSSKSRNATSANLHGAVNLLDDISDTLITRTGQLKSFIAGSRIGKTAAISGAGLFAASLFQNYFYPDRKSNLLVPSYDEWFESNAEFFGNNESFIRAVRENLQIEGMQEGGFAADLRKAITDFGSPYDGPSYSNSVLDDFKLSRLRNQMVRRSFYETHFSFGHVDQLLKAFTSPIGGYKRETSLISYYPYQTKIDPEEYQHLKGKNLVKLNLTDGYKLSMEDADTLTIQGAGNSPLNQFMGTSKYSFRLAGIDAPETAHSDRPSQPYAEEAKRIASAMIRRAKNVEIVVDPSESTYGRQVAMVYADGRNVNLELIKRGAAAYLPYRSKKRENMYNEQAFEKAQELAQNSERGMWRKPYFQAYRDIVKKSGQSVTFNQLANVNTVSKSSSLMSMYSIMNTAQNMGFYSAEAAMNAAEIGSNIGALGKRAFKPDARSSMHHETPAAMMQGSSYASEHLEQMHSEITQNMQGRNASRLNNFKSGRFANSNRTLARNSMHVKQSIWNEERYRIKDIYKVKQRKLNRVLDMQFFCSTKH